MEIRSFQPQDADALGELFHCSVRQGAQQHYSAAQLAAWSPAPPRGLAWARRLGNADTVVAEENGRLLGFMAMEAQGYLDLAFVLPEAMGRKVSDAIYAVLEGRARRSGISRMTTQASLRAEPFFMRQGWAVTQRQVVERSGVTLENAWMEKHLKASAP